jgi:peptidylprolyl isomerase
MKAKPLMAKPLKPVALVVVILALFLSARVFTSQGSGEAQTQVLPEKTNSEATTPQPSVRTPPIAPRAVTDGYVTTPTGLQVADFVVGEGEMPKEGSTVIVEYSGFLTDGTLFDSSLKRPAPFLFPLGQGRVIKGWDEGIASMRVGGERQLLVPPDLGYGSRDKGKIPPGSTLVFDVKLVGIEPPRLTPTAAPQEVNPADVQTTASGLQFVDFKVGEGAQPKIGSRVAVDYTGWLSDGTRFDSSLTRSRPLQFRVGIGKVIPAWDEGILSMKVGGHRQLIVPPGLGYGAGGMPPRIPPNSTLIFEVNLRKVH